MVHKLVLAAVSAALLASVSTIAGAADIIDPPIVELPEYDEPAPVQTGGWYIRGDIGYSMNDLKGAHYFQGSNANLVDFATAEIDDSWVVGAGVGYNIRSYLRTDLTLDYFSKADFLGSTTNGVYTTTDVSSMSALVLMANAYVDLGTYHGITPYVGAGIGGAHVKWKDLSNTIPPGNVGAGTTVHAGASDWRFAYSATVGASYCVTDRVEADANYRYTRIEGGNMFGYVANGGPGYDKGADLHQFRLGARYSFTGNSRCAPAAKSAMHVPEYTPIYK